VNTAVVTGAARGMGRETARRLSARGYQVLVTDLNPADLRLVSHTMSDSVTTRELVLGDVT